MAASDDSDLPESREKRLRPEDSDSFETPEKRSKSNTNQFGFCTIEECTRGAIFGSEAPIRCQIHREPEDIDFRGTRCQICPQRAVFAFNKRYPARCSSHREEGQFYILSHCEQCHRKPKYGEEFALRCYRHRRSSDVFRLARRYSEVMCTDCPHRATHGPIRKKLRCDDHKLDSDIFQSDGRCIDSLDCVQRAIYGPIGKRLRCDDHKLDSDVFQTDGRCIDSLDCVRRAIYGPMGGRKLRCELHKLEEDIKFPMIFCESCLVIAQYGPSVSLLARDTDGEILDRPPKELGVRCQDHRLATDVYRLPFCQDCLNTRRTRARFGPPGETPIRCGIHRLSTDLPLIHKKFLYFSKYY